MTRPVDAHLRPPPEPLSPSEAHLAGLILEGYRQGCFPMADPDTGETGWYKPRRRAILPLDERFHVPRRLAKTVRQGRFLISTDRDFAGVVRACAEPRPGREETWLSEEIIAFAVLLHRAGHAHSIEAFLADPEAPEVRARDTLVGGVYGVVLGSAFAGESMFSRPELGGTDASKVCLVHLVEHLRGRGFTLFDAQLANPHTEQFGLYEISERSYETQLAACLKKPRAWVP